MPDQERRNPTGGWRHPGWSWTVRHNRPVAAGYGLATLLAGGVLGIVPSLVTGDWKSGLTWALLWTCIGLAILAAAAAGFSETARRGRERMLRENGTAYIIQEQARFWADDNAQRFRGGIRRQFARVVQVPGPVETGRGWDWPLDVGARYWDGKADELVRAFRVLNIDETRDGTVTPNGVFLWAYWAVAMAFGMRVTAADRSLVLDVWQRPSRARAGEVDPEIWAQRPHRFGSAPASTGPEIAEFTWETELAVSRTDRRRTAVTATDVSVLLVRFSGWDWGPLSGVTASKPENPSLRLHVRDAAGVAPAGTSHVDLYELRCVPSGSQFPWQDFPALAAEAAAWMEGKAKELSGHTLLLGTLMPQEVGLGLGILAGQESRRASWPAHLWPIVSEPATRELVIPNLDLGSAAIDPALSGTRGE
jgi:hypothetical protein